MFENNYSDDPEHFAADGEFAHRAWGFMNNPQANIMQGNPLMVPYGQQNGNMFFQHNSQFNYGWSNSFNNFMRWLQAKSWPSSNGYYGYQ